MPANQSFSNKNSWWHVSKLERAKRPVITRESKRYTNLSPGLVLSWSILHDTPVFNRESSFATDLRGSYFPVIALHSIYDPLQGFLIFYCTNDRGICNIESKTK
jgi:hypothetical protein